MCEISNSQVQRFQSWYFMDKPYGKCVKSIFVDSNFLVFVYYVEHGYTVYMIKRKI